MSNKKWLNHKQNDEIPFYSFPEWDRLSLQYRPPLQLLFRVQSV